jgi:hypothetical protein
MNKIKFPILLPIALLFLLIAAGCSGKIGISGTVKFTDGEPLNRGTVCFRSADGAITFTGYLNAKGHYRIGEMKDGDGIPPGTYRVWISGSEQERPILQPDGRATGFKTDRIIATQFTSPEESGLSIEVKSGGTKTFDFKVSKP